MCRFNFFFFFMNQFPPQKNVVVCKPLYFHPCYLTFFFLLCVHNVLAMQLELVPDIHCFFCVSFFTKFVSLHWNWIVFLVSVSLSSRFHSSSKSQLFSLTFLIPWLYHNCISLLLLRVRNTVVFFYLLPLRFLCFDFLFVLL